MRKEQKKAGEYLRLEQGSTVEGVQPRAKGTGHDKLELRNMEGRVDTQGAGQFEADGSRFDDPLNFE